MRFFYRMYEYFMYFCNEKTLFAIRELQTLIGNYIINNTIHAENQ